MPESGGEPEWATAEGSERWRSSLRSPDSCGSATPGRPTTTSRRPRRTHPAEPSGAEEQALPESVRRALLRQAGVRERSEAVVRAERAGKQCGAFSSGDEDDEPDVPWVSPPQRASPRALWESCDELWDSTISAAARHSTPAGRQGRPSALSPEALSLAEALEERERVLAAQADRLLQGERQRQSQRDAERRASVELSQGRRPEPKPEPEPEPEPEHVPEPEPEPEPELEPVPAPCPASLPRCPAGHELQPFSTPLAGYTCDQCGDRLPAHSRVYSCRPCEYDICVGCHSARLSAEKRGTAAPGPADSAARVGSWGGSMLEEVGQMSDFPFELSSVGGGRVAKRRQRRDRHLERTVALAVLLIVLATCMVDPLNQLQAALLSAFGGGQTQAADL